MLLVLVAREVLLIVCCLVGWSLVPAALGMSVTTVMSDSMAPGIRAGDVVVARPVGPDDVRNGRVRTGNVLLVADPDRPGRFRLHRWIGVRDDELVLRGDANARPDSSAVAPSAVRAVGFLRIPLVGLPVLWSRTGHPLPLAITLAGVLLAVRLAFPSEPASHRPARGHLGRLRRRPHPATAAVPLLVGLLVVQTAAHPAASAVFSSTTAARSRSGFSSQVTFDCFAKTYPGVPAASLRYSYTASSTPIETDQSGSGRDGRLTLPTTMRVGATCSGNPYISTSTSSTYSFQTTAVTSPAQFGVSVWFRTTTAGGKLAGFGDAGSGGSTTYDRHVYMSNTGQLTFGIQTDSGPVTCTSSGTFADGAWHLVVATYAAGALTMRTDDGQAACTASTGGSIISYQGYWQFGNDTLNRTVWANASTKSYFIGDLDETAVYDQGLAVADERAIWAAGR